MNKLSVIIFLAFVAVEGTKANLIGSEKGAKRFFDLKHSRSDSDFKGLNKYLSSRLKDEDAELNLALIERFAEELSGKTKMAAIRVLGLAEYNTCNDHVLSTVEQLDGAGFKLMGTRRLEKVIKPHLSRALKACTDYIEKTVEQRFFSSPLAVSLTNIAAAATTVIQDKKFEPAKKSLTRQLFHPVDSKNKYYPVDEHIVSDILKVLAKDDPKAKFSEQVDATGKSKTIKRKDNFEYAFNKYLVEPCKEMDSTLGDLLEASGHVANVQNSNSDDLYSFVEQRSVMFQGLAWMYKDCRAVLNMGDSKKATMLKNLTV